MCTTNENLLATRPLLRPPLILLAQQLSEDLQPALDRLRQFVDLLVALVDLDGLLALLHGLEPLLGLGGHILDLPYILD